MKLNETKDNKLPKSPLHKSGFSKIDVIKPIVALLVFAVAFVSIIIVMENTSETAVAEQDVSVSDYINLKLVVENSSNEIYYDTNTGVMYYFFDAGTGRSRVVAGTVILNADGTPKIYTKEETGGN